MKRIHLEIALGTLFVIASAVLLIIMASEEPARLARFEVEQRAEQIEFGALVFETNCTNCHGSHAQGIPGKAPCLKCPEFFSDRLGEVGWGGSLEDYVVSVVTTGRQVSTRPALYQGEGTGVPVMPTWSDQFGGPLREDQIRAVAAFIVNFESWAAEPEAPEAYPTPLFSVDVNDPIAVGRVAFVQYGCVGCHTVEGLSTATTGPVMNGIATRAAIREGYESAEDYILTSIQNPGDYVVEGFNDGVMPINFGEIISEEDLTNLLAFLMTLTEE
ncbi:MAG: c-type cytochrome [Anaerolineae bacterium]|nr:MAG: c-type cytochrome [Anaerolineae bacterium]